MRFMTESEYEEKKSFSGGQKLKAAIYLGIVSSFLT